MGSVNTPTTKEEEVASLYTINSPNPTEDGTTDMYKVRLVNQREPRNLRQRVVFDVSPDVVETQNVNYKSIDPIHAPGQFMAYTNTSSRTFSVSQIRLISRTVEEATRNLQYLWLLRSWTKPYFGKSTLNDENMESREFINKIDSQYVVNRDRTLTGDVGIRYDLAKQSAGKELRGAPPAVLLFSAYSANMKSIQAQHINKVPVVLTSLSIPYPTDCDYIPTSAGSGQISVPMPTIMTIDLQLTESHAPVEYDTFDLRQYRNGTLPGF